jgi:hypothetical protein
MEACVTNKAGKDDVRMVMNFFVLTRVRQAYEYNITGTLPAREWVEQGSPPSELPVFGVTDLRITKTAGDEAGDLIRYRAVYTLWIPIGGESEEGSSRTEAGPVAHPRVEELVLTRLKGSWRISAIDRVEG